MIRTAQVGATRQPGMRLGPQEMGIRFKEKFVPGSLQGLFHMVDAS